MYCGKPIKTHLRMSSKGFPTYLAQSSLLTVIFRAAALPLVSLVSPASSAPPIPATGGVGATEPKTASLRISLETFRYRLFK